MIQGAKFYSKLLSLFNKSIFTKEIEEILEIKPSKKWFNYACSIAGLKLREPSEVDLPDDTNIPTYSTTLYISDNEETTSWTVESEDNTYPDQIVRIQSLYDQLKTLSDEERKKAIEITFANNK